MIFNATTTKLWKISVKFPLRLRHDLKMEIRIFKLTHEHYLSNLSAKNSSTRIVSIPVIEEFLNR